MDPLFERRELRRNVHIESKFLQRNIHASLLAQLRMKYEGVCAPEGFIQPRSITIVEHSLGRSDLIKGGLNYTIRFQADLCLPHAGQVLRAKVELKSKIGLHAEITPIKILLPRDLHIGMAEFEDIEEGQEIEFEVVGSRFQQGDDSIVVLGKIRQIIQDAVEAEPLAATPVEMPMIAAPVGGNDPSEKRVVTISAGAGTPVTEVRRKRVRLNPVANTNE
jgi:DNA-directed RNA polymerase subunit E'/Rpb7